MQRTSANLGAAMPLRDLVDNIHGPLYALLQNLWCRAAGTSEWAIRAPSALFGAAMVPVMAAVARRWLGPGTATLAAWLTALSPFLVWYSQEARSYTLLMLCAALAAWALLRMRERASVGRMAASFAALAAGMLSHPSFLLLAPLHLRWWLSGPRRGRRWIGIAAAGAALLALAAPWIPRVAGIWDFRRLAPGGAETEPLRGATTFHAAAIPFALHAFAVGYSLGPSLRELRARPGGATLAAHAPELAVVGLLFGALGLLALRALARRRRLLDAALWIALPALLVSFFALRNFKVFHPRYLAVAVPALLLALAAALADLRPRLRAAALAAIGIVWGVSLVQLAFDPAYAKEDYRGAARLVAARARPGEKVLALGADEPLFYYYRGPAPLERFWLGYVRRPARLRERWDQVRAGTRGVWVVLSRPEDLDPEGRFQRFIEAQHADAFRLEGVRVWHWTAPGAATADSTRR